MYLLKTASLETRHELYNSGFGDSRYKHKLKERLEKEFGYKITFLINESSARYVIINKDTLEAKPFSNCFEKSSYIKVTFAPLPTFGNHHKIYNKYKLYLKTNKY